MVTVMSVVVRAYRSEDRPAALALAARLDIGVAPWRDPAAVRAAVTSWVHGSLDLAATGERTVLVAVRDDVLVGFVTLGHRAHFTGEVDGYVSELAVAAGEERRGVGRELMRAAERWAQEQGYRRLTLETGAANHSARAFYAALGYTEEDVRLTRTLPD
jgi:ribosomal protein S18 acetylase RimI-like enzyme